MRKKPLAFVLLSCLLLVQACALQPIASGSDRSVDEPATAVAARVAVDVDSASAPMPSALRGLVGDDRMPDFLLLGEVHDHPLHHRLRLDWLTSLSALQPVAIVMEQFDQDRQSDLDAARERGDSARDLAGAAGFRFNGWDWTFYEPVVRLALERGNLLFAANLSAERARAIARGSATGEAALADWSAADQLAMEGEIDRGHCGMLPATALGPMARAQLTRDATMATAMLRARRESGLPVVLIAGNGHVRRDLGVPRHLLARMPAARIISVGFLERGQTELIAQADAGSPGAVIRYDLAVLTPPHQRPDPCEVFRQSHPRSKTSAGSIPNATPGSASK